MLSRLNPTWRDISLRVVHFARLCVRSLRASCMNTKMRQNACENVSCNELNSLGYLSTPSVYYKIKKARYEDKGEVKTS